jgi:S-adenosylmethionine hydrolase
MTVVTLLSDYGLEDEFAGVLHGVIAARCPDARVIDITHGIARHDVRRGALVLASALAHMPAGVHVAIVDPTVGGPRRAVALRTAERILVGPDNGLLAPAAQRLGPVLEAVEISHSRHRLEPVSATFHGRDIFAPVAAALAAREPFRDAGEPFDPDELAGLELPAFADGVAHALLIDRFGNVALDVQHGELALRIGERVEVNGRAARYVRTFADVPAGELLLYEDSNGRFALAVNRGSAAAELGVSRDDEIRLA